MQADALIGCRDIEQLADFRSSPPMQVTEGDNDGLRIGEGIDGSLHDSSHLLPKNHLLSPLPPIGPFADPVACILMTRCMEASRIHGRFSICSGIDREQHGSSFCSTTPSCLVQQDREDPRFEGRSRTKPIDPL